MDKFRTKAAFEVVGASGYSDFEMRKMESFYDIAITGGLRCFFSEMGRASGNRSFNAMVVPYSGYYAPKLPSGISGHIAAQIEFRNQVLRAGRPFRTGKPFLFSIENETQYFFLRTKADKQLHGVTPEDDYSVLSEDPEQVYQYDENADIVFRADMTLTDYLVSRLSPTALTKSGAGEMIVL